jgi:hypothetical protein
MIKNYFKKKKNVSNLIDVSTWNATKPCEEL